jgi:hypothetical protein
MDGPNYRGTRHPVDNAPGGQRVAWPYRRHLSATSDTMVTLGPPQKTPEGIAELSARSRGLTQRHRTLLLLIDGQRSLDQVLHLAHQAGVPRAYMDELVALGLVVAPSATGTPGATLAPTLPPTAAPLSQASAPARPAPGNPGAIDIELGSDVVVNGPGVNVGASPSQGPSRGPAEGTGLGPVDSTLGADLEDDSDPWDDNESFGRALSTSELSALDSSDQSLAEARHVLLQALRQEAPVSGAVTMLRVRRARNREALVALLPEVEQKIGSQRHLSDAARILRRVHELLAV